ncbi:MAG: hypothetical protein ACJ77V_12045 [Chloroflexota bacterium]|jgi:hypothetical protein
MRADKDQLVDPTQGARAAPTRDRLTAMLVEQRRRRDARDAEVRGSVAWGEADAKLDRVNTRLWHLAATGRMPPDAVGDGVTTDIDSIPESDEDFRRAVVRSIKDAVGDHVRSSESWSENRLAASARTAGAALDLMAQAQERLRRTYPDADLHSTDDADDVIGVVAFRDGEVA